MRQVMFEDVIYDSDGIDDHRIIRCSNSQAHEVEEITTNDVPCMMFAASIGDKHLRMVRVG
jgi:hypothetical protein